MTTSRKFTEGQLVEQPAIELFRSLGWETLNAYHETLGSDGTLGRSSQSEVVLVRHLRSALERLNPTLPAEAIQIAVDTLTRDLLLFRLFSGEIDVTNLDIGNAEPAA